MSTYLKTLARCRVCGGEAKIRRLKDAERAMCEHCREADRMLRCAGDREWAASKHQTEAPGLADPARAAAFLRAAAERLVAAAYVLEACAHGLKAARPGDERRWLAWARGRVEWGSEMARNSIPLVAEARDAAGHGLVAVPGDGLLTQAPASAPRLRIVGVGEPQETLFTDRSKQ